MTEFLNLILNKTKFIYFPLTGNGAKYEGNTFQGNFQSREQLTFFN
jgi:hypothetical protein